MDKDKEKTIELDAESKEILARVEASLRKAVEDGKKYGFDVKKHWEEMLTSLDEEETEAKEVGNGFAERFAEMSDAELISAFNREVGNRGWTSARARYLSMMRKEFDKRSFDYSSIGDDTSMSYKNKIVLVGKKIEQEKG